MQIQKRTLGWFQQQTAWQEMQARRQKSAAYRKKDEAQRTALNNILQTQATDQFFGAGDLAARAALKRIGAETEAKKRDNAAKAADAATMATIYNNKKPPAQVTAGDSKIDLANGTLTLSNGTSIDVKTGLPTGKYLTLADGSRIDLNTGHKVIDTKV